MPEPKTRKKARRPVRFVKSAPPGKRAPKRAKARKPAARSSAVQRRTRARKEAEQGLPGWSELSGSDTGRSRQELGGFFATVSTLRLALMIVAAAALLTMYVGHVYATSELLAEVDTLRRQNLELHLERNQVKAAFDRISSPARISSRARQLGLVEVVPAGTPIRLDRR